MEKKWSERENKKITKLPVYCSIIDLIFLKNNCISILSLDTELLNNKGPVFYIFIPNT